MKPAILIPPLVLVALLIYHQGTRDRSAEPRETPAKAVDRNPVRESEPEAPGIDWKGISGGIEDGSLSGRIDETSRYGRFLQELETMTGPGIIAAREELRRADLPDLARTRIESHLMGALVRKDVELALTYHRDQLREPAGEKGTILLGGFRDWAVQFPTKAEFWLDARIRDGSFDSGSEAAGFPPRVLYERELMRSLLVASPEKAAARLEALPEPWRIMALQGTDSVPSQRAYATLVRKHFSEPEQHGEFKRMATAARYLEGPEGIPNVLDRIEATPAEREMILRHTGGESDGVPSGDH